MRLLLVLALGLSCVSCEKDDLMVESIGYKGYRLRVESENSGVRIKSLNGEERILRNATVSIVTSLNVEESLDGQTLEVRKIDQSESFQVNENGQFFFEYLINTNKKINVVGEDDPYCFRPSADVFDRGLMFSKVISLNIDLIFGIEENGSLKQYKKSFLINESEYLWNYFSGLTSLLPSTIPDFEIFPDTYKGARTNDCKGNGFVNNILKVKNVIVLEEI